MDEKINRRVGKVWQPNINHRPYKDGYYIGKINGER